MAAWQPPEEDMDPELALALELDLLSDQDLLDVAGLAWPEGLQGSGGSGGPAANATAPAPAPWPANIPLPQLPAWTLAAGQQPVLPVLGMAPAGLGTGWHGDAAAAAEAAAAAAAEAAAAPTAASAATTTGARRTAATTSCKPGTPRRGGKVGSATSRYDKPGARERKQEQQRNYRLRVKERTAEQQAQLAALEAAVEAERQQRQQLLDEHAALQKVQDYKDSLAKELPLADGGTVPQAEDSSGASGTQADQAALPLPGSRAALTSGAAAEDGGGDVSCSSSTKVVELSGGASGSGDGSGGPCSSSEGSSSGGAPLGNKDGDWEPVFPTHWCKVGLASGGLPAPAAALVDAAASLADEQHALPYEGSGGLLSGMAAALLAVPDVLCRRLMGGIKPYQLVDRECGFRNLIKAAVEEWEANPAGRLRMEYRLKILWAVRLKCSSWLARIRPEVVAEARASYVLPAPLPATAAAVTGGPAPAEGGMEGGVHHMLPPIVAKLQITREQCDRILAHWRAYQQRVAVARQLSREAIQRLQRQEAARLQSGIPGPSGSLAGAAGHFLSSLHAASELAALPSEETAAWFELQHGLWQALTPLQNSRLLLGCAPYLPDCTQLCRLLEWQQQRQQLSRGDSGHFLATAVAVGGPAN